MPRELKTFVVEEEVQPIELANPRENGDGKPKKYEIRELGGRSREKYMKAASDRVKTLKNGTRVIKSFVGMYSELLNLCMYDVNGDKPKQVSKDFIDSLPGGLQQELFDIAQDISKVAKVAEDSRDVELEMVDKLEDTFEKFVEIDPEDHPNERELLIQDFGEILEGLRELMLGEESPEVLAKND